MLAVIWDRRKKVVWLILLHEFASGDFHSAIIVAKGSGNQTDILAASVTDLSVLRWFWRRR